MEREFSVDSMLLKLDAPNKGWVNGNLNKFECSMEESSRRNVAFPQQTLGNIAHEIMYLFL